MPFALQSLTTLLDAPRCPHSLQKEVMTALVRLHPDCPPVVKLIAEHRRLAYSVWLIQQLLTCARACAAAGEGSGPAAAAGVPGKVGGGERIFAVLHQTNSDTGRLAMDDPSLQCVPRTHELRMLLQGTARKGDNVSASGLHRCAVFCGQHLPGLLVCLTVSHSLRMSNAAVHTPAYPAVPA